MRLIDADALLAAELKKIREAKELPQATVGGLAYLDAYEVDITLALKYGAPTNNPDDLRPQGRWEEIRNDYGELEGWLHVDCGRESKSKDKYCGTCGAKMDGGNYNGND